MAEDDQPKGYCLACRWWDQSIIFSQDSKIPATTSKRKLCRRLPMENWKTRNDWCGEFEPMCASKHPPAETVRGK